MSSEILTKHHSSIQPDQLLEIGQRINCTALRLQRLIQNFLLYAQLEIMAENPEKAKGLLSGQITSSKKVITKVATEMAEQQNRESDLSLELLEASVQVTDIKL